MATAARRAAFRVLGEVEGPGPTLADRLATPDVEALDPRDRALLHELVLGTLRHRGRVDQALAAVLDQPLTGLEAPIRTALRLGAYQLLRTRIPPRAAVSESVDLARQAAPRGAGLVNAVLRKLSREGPPPVPEPARDPLGWLVSEGSLPRWLAERWLARLGPAVAVARAQALLETPPFVFRLNPRRPEAMARAEAAGLQPEPLIVPGAWRAPGAGAAGAELTAAGLLYAQDQGSQAIAALAVHGSLVLDACAAPGGKSLVLADALHPGGRVVAAELSSRRLHLLAQVTRRWGADNVRIVGADAARPPFDTSFDAVLLDAPCSGLGTLGRHPDIRWRARPADLLRHADRQRALLEALATRVRPGGRLVYAVCSAEPEETEEVIAPFLEAHPELRRAELPAWAAPLAEGPYLRTRPERDAGGDAFFAAVLVR